MSQFEYQRILDSLMTPAVVSALGGIREHRGRQELYKALEPTTMERLCEVARIQSTGASNRIENISTSEVRLRELMEQKTKPTNRDEREIAGYRYVLDMIHERHDGIPVTPGVILQLHRDLYRYCDVSFAGRWKDSDNVIAERTEDGRMVARFVPTSAAATPRFIGRICEEYGRWVEDGTYDLLLVSLVFIFDFVSIHPFNDGNGRMSRLLTLLLLYRTGYPIGKYISIERLIADSKGSYYETLQASSENWHEGNNDYLPFVRYLLGVIIAAYREFAERAEILLETGNSKISRIRRLIRSTTGKITKSELMAQCPDISQVTIQRALKELTDSGDILKIGGGRYTSYVWNWNKE